MERKGKMNLKLKAALQAGGFVMGVSAVSITLQVLASYFTVEDIATGLTWFFLAFCIYMIYQINLSRLESESETKKIIEETKEIVAKYR
jgi:hypothetical protein